MLHEQTCLARAVFSHNTHSMLLTILAVLISRLHDDWATAQVRVVQCPNGGMGGIHRGQLDEGWGEDVKMCTRSNKAVDDVCRSACGEDVVSERSCNARTLSQRS